MHMTYQYHNLFNRNLIKKDINSSLIINFSLYLLSFIFYKLQIYQLFRNKQLYNNQFFFSQIKQHQVYQLKNQINYTLNRILIQKIVSFFFINNKNHQLYVQFFSVIIINVIIINVIIFYVKGFIINFFQLLFRSSYYCPYFIICIISCFSNFILILFFYYYPLKINDFFFILSSNLFQ
ncbi:hypothetical protein PPERSA_03847 [Pseudocohnilembus persalinus]|uniref:Transmembrane protein n=1 Tax=Pseudocohnilembus persalinus TaxID=266149 RepID=A0A0V0QUT7_PSEPJ|nr:hypothetical protein PPERSA_03847 [Pseudocohnilembus persalinus]|eukprot:KRX05910.1 hypothetical protein PPERSA_03847 [Pseudocohnilembus persalinus]